MMRVRMLSTASMVVFTALPALYGEWNKQLAAEYLDGRQKAWFEWPVSAATGGPCVSCHTGVSYLFARPVLRRELGEHQPTSYETGLLDGLRTRLDQDKTMFHAPADAQGAREDAGVDAVISALSLTLAEKPGSTLSAHARTALDRMWSRQIRDGEAAGAWPWFDLNLDPWETAEATFYGATLAALATGHAPASYPDQPEVHQHIAALAAYLKREQQTQPLHNRLMLVWASVKLPEVVSEATRQQIVNEVLKKQEADGGWSIQSLGPWKRREAAPRSEGSNTYATALAAFTLQQAGVGRFDARMARATDWLKGHQDAETGAWPADSMNKKYEAGSIPELFMRDAATAFAALALLEDGR